MELCYNQIRYDLTHDLGIDAYVSPFEMSFLGWLFVQLALQGTVLLLVRVLLHWDIMQGARWVPRGPDPRAFRERERKLPWSVVGVHSSDE